MLWFTERQNNNWKKKHTNKTNQQNWIMNRSCLHNRTHALTDRVISTTSKTCINWAVREVKGHRSRVTWPCPYIPTVLWSVLKCRRKQRLRIVRCLIIWWCEGWEWRVSCLNFVPNLFMHDDIWSTFYPPPPSYLSVHWFKVQFNRCKPKSEEEWYLVQSGSQEFRTHEE